MEHANRIPGEGKDPTVEADEPEIDEVEIEAFAKRGATPPRAKRYVIRVDKQTYTVETATLTGAQILALAGKAPAQYKLYQHVRGHQPILVVPDTVVDLRAPGVERFTTMAKDTTEGRGDTALALRRQFRLPAGDEEYLDAVALPWEAVVDGSNRWLLIHDWRVPEGYSVQRVSLALLIPPQYADTQIDMAYFTPALVRADGRAINNLSQQTICGDPWQRWSRHRTPQNPWRVGVDDLASHLALVDDWLRREFEGTR
jgi:hypothetical protein